MYLKTFLFAVIIVHYFSYANSQDSQNSCIGLQNCAACIQNPMCAWCSQSDFHGQDKKPLPRCNFLSHHEQLGRFKCTPNQLFKHDNSILVERNDSLSNGNANQNAVPIQPQKLSLKMRVNDPISFEMKYMEVEDYPLDLYYLMDGTYTMKDDKEVLVSLGDAIGERMSSLTHKYRQGFGTFVDKTTMPYVLTIPKFFENPCYFIGETCTKPYGFHNHMPLSTNTKQFAETVKGVLLSGSTDSPEGGFDALMQVMVCEKQIGWSEQARHLVIFATDAPFHYAGDGKLGGVLLPNDGNCHMDSKGEFYTHSLVTDYPSIAQINSKAKKHSVNIIFAVTSNVTKEYESLSAIIEASKTTELAKNSSNIVDLVEEEYKRITSKVEIKDSFPSEYFKVRYFSKCSSSSDVEMERNFCEGLQPGIVVPFRVEIELIKCPQKKSEWKQQYRIYAVGVPDSIEIDVETLCDCPCENPENRIPNSQLCNRAGSEICGLCECNENYFGKSCECSSTGKRVDESTACKMGNSTEICSGRGNCVCGQCMCTNSRYSGSFCECDNHNCPLINGALCADHGDCDCGKCKCSDGWEGPGCDCFTSKVNCFESGSSEECSGQGACVCGKCQCKGKFSGKYCEKCLVPESCPNKCDDLKYCVQCKLYGTGIYNAADCELNCFRYSIKQVDSISGGADSSEIVCKAEDSSDECVFIFSYNDNNLNHINAQITKECPPKAPIIWILVITTSIVVLIGLIILCMLKAFKAIRDKREFAAYENERKNVAWGQGDNPLYATPINTFKNPLYQEK